jgi:hypothetical protein
VGYHESRARALDFLLADFPHKFAHALLSAHAPPDFTRAATYLKLAY